MPIYGGLYSGLEYQIIDLSISNASYADSIFNNLVENRKEDSVVSVFMFPNRFINYDDDTMPMRHYKTIHRKTKFGSYTPKNKKLFTYPYCYLNVDTVNSAHDYRFEWSNNGSQIQFAMYTSLAPNPEIIVAPMYYNGSADTLTGNTSESIVCNGFPQCAFTIDSYRAYIANRAAGDFFNMATQGISTATSFATGNFVGGVLGVTGMANSLNNIVLSATKANQVRGSQGSSGYVGNKTKDIYFRHMQITEQYARIIDDFFDRYGYSCCRVKYPNIASRPHWNYTKTKNCNAVGEVPSDDLAKIKRIFDNGITFWKHADEVGNYSLNNTPVQTGGE